MCSDIFEIFGRHRHNHDAAELVRRGGAAGRRTAPPLRTTGCLKAPESARLRAAYPRGFEISVRTVLCCTAAHPRISLTRMKQGRKLLEFWGSLGG
jgi:hypothetical protein